MDLIHIIEQELFPKIVSPLLSTPLTQMSATCSTLESLKIHAEDKTK